MFAFIKHSGKQFKVSEGCTIFVDKISAEKGEVIDINEVTLIVQENSSIQVNPKAKVVCEVLDQKRSKKVLVLKQRPKKGYRRKKGHRQDYTKLLIKQIQSL